ncbi:MAG: hypothetical protein R2909_03700 [Gemmatimonadales bacterium]
MALAGFMAFGFVLIYLRDFAPGKSDWIASYATGTHFESRLAHAHGNLFAVLNLVYGVLLGRLDLPYHTAQGISWLAFTGLLMPIGILGEVAIGAPPIFVLVGGLAMLAGTVWLGVAALRTKPVPSPDALS